MPIDSIAGLACRGLASDGFYVLENVFDSHAIDAIIGQLSNIDIEQKGAITARSNRVVASRNVIEQIPELISIIRGTIAQTLVELELGTSAGLVRVLFFDKPPWRSWTLPWHKDMTIAVADNSLKSSHFSKPTRKGGVAHVEASTEILEQMLTLRIHLDPNREENGALKVIPGSHQSGKENISGGNFVTVETSAGAVLAMKPLLSHSSGHTDPNTKLHRRTLHFEFAASRQLPDRFEWHDFIPLHVAD